MEILAVILLVGFVGYKYLSHSANIAALKSDGDKIIDRPKQFMRQKHIFTTKVTNIYDVYNKLDLESLKSVRIEVGSTSTGGGLEFVYSYNMKSGFTAFLRCVSSENDMQKYVFYLSEIEGNIGDMEANVLLTAIEKAFMSLDNDVVVDRELVEFKSKSGCKHYYCAFEKNGMNLDHYKCSKYSRTFDRCDNPHYILKSELEELVLMELNSLIKQIQFDEADFLKKLEQKFKIESNRKNNKQRQKLLNDKRRFEEIDQIIQRLYEDNLVRKLSDDRFIKMIQNYELEQSRLKDSIYIVKQELSMQENQSMDISRFMQRIHKYTQITELSVEIVNELIDKIIIHKPEGNKRNRILKIEIHYNFIGNLGK
ncbi:hypothetical protein A9Y58_00041 [Streptococcus parauberis]|uniref:DUF4368 domain-containing protein n=1 Tax=Streptococcus parauberis TaxID=1348 RepID=UPI0009767571|nr:DUF4368 domain-containing protein [Streptococcus parauberis]ONH62988.1 hypothetical protein ASN87_01727 [Streptococcus parauberis]PCH14542.1 hypothetical protein A9Y58_00041 [Streptococcus parauberis]